MAGFLEDHMRLFRLKNLDGDEVFVGESESLFIYIHNLGMLKIDLTKCLANRPPVSWVD